jgi:hypothetical protein
MLPVLEAVLSEGGRRPSATLARGDRLQSVTNEASAANTPPAEPLLQVQR